MHKDAHHPPVSKLVYREEPVTVDDLTGRELFEDVGHVALAAIAKHSRCCTLEAQETLYLTNKEHVDYIYIILSGYVAIWINSQFTDEEETFLAWRGPEQVIGEMKVVADKQLETRIVTCERCEFIEMRSDNFTDVAHCGPQIYRNIARLLVKKMEHERCRSEIIRMSPARRQVAQTLLHLADERCGRDQLNKANEIEIPGIVHQDEIAGFVGVKRETTNRGLSELRREKTISYVKNVKGSQITIRDRKALEHIALRERDEPA